MLSACLRSNVHANLRLRTTYFLVVTTAHLVCFFALISNSSGAAAPSLAFRLVPRVAQQFQGEFRWRNHPRVRPPTDESLVQSLAPPSPRPRLHSMIVAIL